MEGSQTDQSGRAYVVTVIFNNCLITKNKGLSERARIDCMCSPIFVMILQPSTALLSQTKCDTLEDGQTFILTMFIK